MKILACLLTMSRKLWRGSNPFWEFLRLVHTPKKIPKKISSNDETFEVIDITKYTLYYPSTKKNGCRFRYEIFISFTNNIKLEGVYENDSLIFLIFFSHISF